MKKFNYRKPFFLFSIIVALIIVICVAAFNTTRRTLTNSDLVGSYRAQLDSSVKILILSKNNTFQQRIMLRDGKNYIANGDWQLITKPNGDQYITLQGELGVREWDSKKILGTGNYPIDIYRNGKIFIEIGEDKFYEKTTH